MENEELQGNPEELVGRLLEERDRLERLCKEAMQADRILLQHLGQVGLWGAAVLTNSLCSDDTHLARCCDGLC